MQRNLRPDLCKNQHKISLTEYIYLLNHWNIAWCHFLSPQRTTPLNQLVKHTNQVCTCLKKHTNQTWAQYKMHKMFPANNGRSQKKRESEVGGRAGGFFRGEEADRARICNHYSREPNLSKCSINEVLEHWSPTGGPRATSSLLGGLLWRRGRWLLHYRLEIKIYIYLTNGIWKQDNICVTEIKSCFNRWGKIKTLNFAEPTWENI